MARLIDPKTGTAVHVEGNLERRYRALGWSEKITKRSGKPAAKPVEALTEVEDSGNATEADAAQASMEDEAGDTSAVAEADEVQADAAEAEQAEATEAPATRRNTRRNK